ncbi:MAG: hypothetical protein JWM80_2695 [Cyanobacteria bacterium RYN_339]|nr:hypothetical protein [Cyanobacteria bacterium RYN_339]
MPRRIAFALVPLLVLTACSGQPSVAVKASKASTKALAGLPAQAPRLVTAPTDAVRLEGTVQLDANYAVNKAGGKLLLNGSAKVTAPEGGKLVGTSVISNDGASVVAQGGGNVIVEGAPPMISNDGASIVAQGGGNIVAQGAGNIVAQGAGNLRSVQAVDELAVGAQLPAVGMVVQVRTLRDDKRVALGIDPQGKPVYAIYTNLDGKFKLFLPRTVAENVRIVVTPRTKDDRRLRYAIMGMANAPAQVDEDTSQATGYIARAIAGRVQQLITHKAAEVAAAAPVFNRDLDAVLNAAANRDNKVVADAGALAVKVTNTLLAPIDLNAATFEDADGQNVPCLKTITEIMAVTRQNMGTRMTGMKDATTELAALLPGTEIKKPADFVSFLVDTQLSGLDDNELARFQRIHEVVLKAGLETDDARMLKLAAASNGLLSYIGAQLAGMQATRDAALSMLRGG